MTFLDPAVIRAAALMTWQAYLGWQILLYMPT
jgi:hypothetical protein